MDQELQRFDLNTLIQQGRLALKERRPAQAVRLLREAARRAPFRQDLREALSLAMQHAERAGKHGGEAPASAPHMAPHATAPRAVHPQPEPMLDPHTVQPKPLAPQAPHPQHAPAAQHPRTPFPDFESRARSAAPEPPLRRGLGAGRNSEAARGTVPPARRRGAPVAALLTGMVAGLVLLAVVGGGVYYYVQTQGEARAVRERNERFTLAVARAQEYAGQRKYALALEALNTLPPSPDRDLELARMYRDKGNANVAQTPPDYPAAIQDYAAGLKLRPEDVDLGLLLGRAYYLLALDQRETDRTACEQNLQLSRQAYEAVLQRTGAGGPPEQSIEALNYLAQIGTLLRDPVLQRQSYLEIIKINPQSPEAESARRNLQSAGLRM